MLKRRCYTYRHTVKMFENEKVEGSFYIKWITVNDEVAYKSLIKISKFY